MRLHDLLDGVEIVEVRGELDVDVRAIVHDSRDATPGALFCCIPGEHTDGHDHAPNAVGSGAVACLVERTVAVDVPQVRVQSVRRALGPMCAHFHGFPSRALRIAGVTGTNGKTTTTYLIESIARAAGERTGVLGTVGARVGDDMLPLQHTTPEATDLQAMLALMRDRGVQTAAMEVSSHALDQRRVDGTTFAVACFTNLSHDHLDYHRTMDAYFDSKARLFTTAFTDRAVVGLDDARGGELAARAAAGGVSVSTFALDHDADVIARDVVFRSSESAFTLTIGDARRSIALPLVGRINVLNALAAAASAHAMGIHTDAIGAGLSQPVTVPGRMERIDAGQSFTVLVDYAHTPDALTSVLAAARPLVANGGRLVVVFGCGGDRDRAKRPVMGEVATSLADHTIVTSDNPRSEDPEAIAAEVVAGVPRAAAVVELDRRRAIRLAIGGAHDGDVVVIAGKGHEPGQTAGGVTTPFDDRVVAREELEAGA